MYIEVCTELNKINGITEPMMEGDFHHWTGSTDVIDVDRHLKRWGMTEHEITRTADSDVARWRHSPRLIIVTGSGTYRWLFVANKVVRDHFVNRYRAQLSERHL